MRLFFFLATFIWLFACSGPQKTAVETAPVKTLPADVAVGPSSIYCKASLLSSDTAGAWLVVTDILAVGSSLFYSASPGDTLYGKFTGTGVYQLINNASYEMVLEERLKLNSELPEFIIRQIGHVIH